MGAIEHNEHCMAASPLIPNFETKKAIVDSRARKVLKFWPPVVDLRSVLNDNNGNKPIEKGYNLEC
jgi:hypothetical protein